MFLAGPFNLEQHPILRDYFPRDEGILFGKGADLNFDFKSDTFEDLRKQIAPGTAIDFLLYFNPEFNGIPIGIERASFPAIAVVSDWSVNLESVLRLSHFFFRVFIDLAGARLMKRLGYPNVDDILLYGYEPSAFHVMPEVEKKYDVTFVGNLSDIIHQKRSRFLKRLGLLGKKHRIKFFTGVHGPEYLRILNESKITFNHSIRGEMNMRCYEALASGSLLFIEAENEQAKRHFTDKVHCVYYDDTNFEALIGHYLENESERESIVQHMLSIAGGFTTAEMNRQIVEKARQQVALGFSAPPAAAWSETRKARSRIFQALHTSEPPRSELFSQSIVSLDERGWEHPFFSGLYFLEYSDGLASPVCEQWVERALAQFRLSLDRLPSGRVARFNLAFSLLKLGKVDEAISEFQNAAQMPLDSEEKENEWLCYPLYYGSWRLEKEERLRENLPLDNLFKARCLEGEGDAWSVAGNLPAAKACFEKADALRLPSWELLRKIGVLAERLQQPAGAVKAFERALEARPFYIEVWRALPKLYFALGEKEKLSALCDQFVVLSEVFQPFEALREEFEDWLSLSGKSG